MKRRDALLQQCKSKERKKRLLGFYFVRTFLKTTDSSYRLICKQKVAYSHHRHECHGHAGILMPMNGSFTGVK